MDSIEVMEKITAAHEGDETARNNLVIENAGLVYSIIRRFIGRGCDAEDLFQIGNIGLIKAIDKFDTSYNVCFSTYAVPMITGEIKRFLRDDGMIKVSRTLKETACRVRAAREQLENRFGREPTIGEIGEELAIAEEDIILALESGAEIESIYKQVSHNDGREFMLIDKLAEEDKTDRIVNKMTLQEQLNRLSKKERQIIHLRYYEERTQADIAKLYGISQVQVSRLEKAIITKIREHFNE